MKHPEWANAEIGKSRDKVVARGRREEGMGNGSLMDTWFLFRVTEVIRNWIVVMAAQHFEYTTSY